MTTTVKDRLDRISNRIILLKAALSADADRLGYDDADFVMATKPLINDIDADAWFLSKALEGVMQSPAPDDDERREQQRREQVIADAERFIKQRERRRRKKGGAR